jgi:hypothetical protein
MVLARALATWLWLLRLLTQSVFGSRHEPSSPMTALHSSTLTQLRLGACTDGTHPPCDTCTGRCRGHTRCPSLSHGATQATHGRLPRVTMPLSACRPVTSTRTHHAATKPGTHTQSATAASPHTQKTSTVVTPRAALLLWAPAVPPAAPAPRSARCAAVADPVAPVAAPAPAVAAELGLAVPVALPSLGVPAAAADCRRGCACVCGSSWCTGV